MLKIKEIFGPTIEGEGLFAGEKAHFIRLSGCNIWDGREETKAKSMCPYCDTNFNGGEELTVDDIILQVQSLGNAANLVNITGGEPLLQDITELCLKLIQKGYRVNIETNGTKPLPDELMDLMFLYVTCSPKVPYKAIKIQKMNCVKVLYPHPSGKIDPMDFDNFNCKYIQPIEIDGKFNYQECMDKLYTMPADWSLSLQIHKIIGAE